ncbi:MAG TPA: ABC transporter substrate-binding protein [Polyangia bacterium]|nr:ABC transporter substrate-binding protein [Polyangia bacterium]
MRIASLLASGTELVCALGLGESLVGRSHECDEPAWVRALPQLSRPTFPVDGSSREIDEHVRARLRAGRPLYEVDDAALTALAPDVILTQTHCEVCAVSPGDIACGIPARLERRRVVSLDGGTLEAVLAGFESVAGVLGAGQAGRALVRDLRARVEAVATKARGAPPPTVACIEWIDPVFAMGNWGPELVALAGGRSVLGQAAARSTTTTWDAVLAADADVLVVAPCGFSLARTLAEMPALAARPGFGDLRAARAGRVFAADGNAWFNRAGPSLFETPEILAEMLHPGLFPPAHRKIAWEIWP